MKTINEFKSTNKFCIGATEVENMAVVLEFLNSQEHIEHVHQFGKHDPNKMNEYTVRVSTKKALVDFKVSVQRFVGKEEVRILNFVEIVRWDDQTD